MKIGLILVLILLAGSFGLIFLTVPAQKFLLELEKGFSIEKLTYLPGGYGPIPDSDYLDMGGSAARGGLIEVTSNNQSYFLTFGQMGNSKDGASVRDAEINNQYPRAKTTEINRIPTTVHYSSGGGVYIWLKNNKRYEISTNDLFITISDLEKMEEGIVPLKVDVLKPIKDLIETFKTSN
jgi:hypothetical protein